MNLIQKSIDLFVPFTRVTTSPFPKYYSNELKNKIIEKKILQKNFKRFDDSDFYYEKFKDLRRICKKLLTRDENQYRKTIESNIIQKPNGFYNYIKSLKDINDIPVVMRLDNVVVDNLNDTANLFASKFGSVYTTSPSNYRNISQIMNNSIGNIIFTEEEVSNCIDQLSDSLSLGPDGIHMLYVKNCKSVLLGPITNFFNLSIKLGIYPDLWKKSFVTPTFKNGDVQDVANYRPIVKICILAKIFDKLVYERLYRYIVGYIIEQQHGFVTEKSTITNLNVFVDDIVYNSCDGYNTDVVFTDFQRAFDKVNCETLIQKLAYYGVHGNLLSWFGSMLKGRTQRVRIGNIISTS